MTYKEEQKYYRDLANKTTLLIAKPPSMTAINRKKLNDPKHTKSRSHKFADPLYEIRKLRKARKVLKNIATSKKWAEIRRARTV